MPTIEFSYKDLKKLVGKDIPLKELEKEGILFVKGEFEEVVGDQIKIEIADTNRPDLWSVEGIARELRGRYGKEKGLVRYPHKKSGLKVKIHKNLKNIRPLTACAVIKGITITDEVMAQIIQLQEKVCETFGRKRNEAAIGIYDYTKIKGPITFKGYDPDKLRFQPLDYPDKITLRQILSKHQKGREYGHLLEGFDKYPIFIDAADQVLSMPPVINSDHTGKVTKDTKDLFVECSGFSKRFVVPALNVMVAALIDRGGKLETVEIESDGETWTSPDFTPQKVTIRKDFMADRLGIDIPEKKIIDLLEGARYGVKVTKDAYVVSYLPYRQDIMHPMDIIEDVLIGYGFNNIEPVSPEMVTDSSLIEEEQFARTVADIMVGLGGTEIMTYTLTNKENMFARMGLDPKKQKCIEIDNPVSKNWGVFRTWLIPSIMEIFSKNRTKEYPQEIFEIGQVILPDAKAETRCKYPTRICWGLVDKDAGYTSAKQALDFLMSSLGIEYKATETEHDSFIPGRSARVKVGKIDVAYIGEIHPEILGLWKLDHPVAVFELNLSDLFAEIRK